MNVPLDAIIGVHVGCGLGAVAAGAAAMLSPKGSVRHRRLGRIYLVALAGIGVTAPVLAAVDWAHRWHLVGLGAVAVGCASVGYRAVRTRRAARLVGHLSGMGSAYVVMLTAFYVDNGPRLPLWNRLPTAALWLLPAAVGAPLILRAVRRYRPRH